ncbi:MAG: hypothetical protein K2W33_10560 [Burkholderiales bacterium]|nr:hypothetical protein [Burkholderiales bacterium]
MSKKTLYTQLREGLARHVGSHSRMAKETGVSQASISRIHLGIACPTLHKAQPILDWLEREDRRRVLASRGKRGGGQGANSAGATP